MDQFLVGMIDGESVGFALAHKGAALHLEKLWNGKTADYPTFTDALQSYLKMHGLQPRDHDLALAVAGVARGDIISFPNCRWFVSMTGLTAFLRSRPLVLNDFAATAWSLTALDRRHLVTVGPIAPKPITAGSTFLLVGTGCGLGVATLHLTGNGTVVVMESEGGHSSFAPQTPLDDVILHHLRRQFGHVSYERIISEPGLQSVYRALAEHKGVDRPVPTVSEIRTTARHGQDPIATETMKVFIDALGSFVGSTSLVVGAWDGVFLTGEMLNDMAPFIGKGDFRSRFTSKGRLSKSLANVPVALVNYNETRLLGAAAALAARRTAENAPERVAA